MFEILRQYPHDAQIYLILAFVAWWLVGSTWLLHKAIRKHVEKKKEILGQCVLGMFLAGVGGAVVGAMMLQFLLAVGHSQFWAKWMGWVLGGCLGAALAVPMALLVLYAVFQFPLKTLLRVSLLPLGSIALAAVVFGGSAGYLGWSRHLIEGKAAMSRGNLTEIDGAIRRYETGGERQVPKDLLTLTEEFRDAPGAPQKLPKRSLVCPFLPDDPVGYFYFPCPSLDPDKDRQSQVLRACEWKHPYSDRYRSILFANGAVRSTGDADFQTLLDTQDNAAFRAAYLAAEANRR